MNILSFQVHFTDPLQLKELLTKQTTLFIVRMHPLSSSVRNTATYCGRWDNWAILRRFSYCFIDLNFTFIDVHDPISRIVLHQTLFPLCEVVYSSYPYSEYTRLFIRRKHLWEILSSALFIWYKISLRSTECVIYKDISWRFIEYAWYMQYNYFKNLHSFLRNRVAKFCIVILEAIWD